MFYLTHSASCFLASAHPPCIRVHVGYLQLIITKTLTAITTLSLICIFSVIGGFSYGPATWSRMGCKGDCCASKNRTNFCLELELLSVFYLDIFAVRAIATWSHTFIFQLDKVLMVYLIPVKMKVESLYHLSFLKLIVQCEAPVLWSLYT